MLMRDHPCEVDRPGEYGARVGAAALLRAASRLLDRLAIGLERSLDRADAPPPGERLLEFHAEAGAPEGALYVNGQLVGHLTGVTRL
jgi:hypothetical protein